MSLVDVGSIAPDFCLRGPGGGPVRLADFRGRYLVLYFYPKNDTAGCTMEACNFRDLSGELAALESDVIGISPDEPTSHDKFHQKHTLNFPILSDPKDASGVPQVCNSYGVWVQKSLYGRKYWGVERTTYLLNRDGVVVRRWDRVRVPGHAATVVDALRNGAFQTIPSAC